VLEPRAGTGADDDGWSGEAREQPTIPIITTIDTSEDLMAHRTPAGRRACKKSERVACFRAVERFAPRAVTFVLRDPSTRQRRNAMKFVLLIYQGTTPLPGSERWKALPEAEQKQIYADYAQLNQTPGMTQGLPLGLPAAARTVRVVDGAVQVKDGPYQPEGAGGYSVYECDDLEAAIALAARIPAARLGGAIEVRPAEKYW
jgi:hypothetical protein